VTDRKPPPRHPSTLILARIADDYTMIGETLDANA
jgi:hypothetical protein